MPVGKPAAAKIEPRELVVRSHAPGGGPGAGLAAGAAAAAGANLVPGLKRAGSFTVSEIRFTGRRGMVGWHVNRISEIVNEEISNPLKLRAGYRPTTCVTGAQGFQSVTPITASIRSSSRRRRGIESGT